MGQSINDDNDGCILESSHFDWVTFDAGFLLFILCYFFEKLQEGAKISLYKKVYKFISQVSSIFLKYHEKLRRMLFLENCDILHMPIHLKM